MACSNIHPLPIPTPLTFSRSHVLTNPTPLTLSHSHRLTFLRSYDLAKDRLRISTVGKDMINRILNERWKYKVSCVR